jgi:hypothetical protein
MLVSMGGVALTIGKRLFISLFVLLGRSPSVCNIILGGQCENWADI